MHVLITADTVGGVWTYTRELVTGLIGRGIAVTLVSFGGMPSPDQIRWMEHLSNFTYHPTEFGLEWMQDSAGDLPPSCEYLRRVVDRGKPDLLHSNQFCYGSLDCGVPRVVVAHSDVVSWWTSVHGREPPANAWMAWYRETVARGLAGAATVIAPSQWMLGQVERYYLRPARRAVIYNGRTPALFNSHAPKEMKIVAAGRLWDEGKNAALLLRTELPAPLQILGAGRAPGPRGASFIPARDRPGIDLQGRQDEAAVGQTLACAAVYVGASRYEPFGLAPVEAAFSRCALVLSDISSFRELWDGAAVFFRSDDAQDLKQALDLLARDSHLRERYGGLARERALERFRAQRMTDDYLALYQTLTPAPSAAA